MLEEKKKSKYPHPRNNAHNAMLVETHREYTRNLSTSRKERPGCKILVTLETKTKFIAEQFEISDDRIGYNWSNSTTLLECMRTEYMQKQQRKTPRNRTMKRKNLNVKVVKDSPFTFLDNAAHTLVRRVD